MEARTYCSAMMELGTSNSLQNLVVLTLACAAAAWLELEGTGGGDQEDKNRASCPRLKNGASEKPIAKGGKGGVGGLGEPCAGGRRVDRCFPLSSYSQFWDLGIIQRIPPKCGAFLMD